MNLPNILTVLRVVFSFIAAALLCVDIKYFGTAAFIIYLIAAVSDWFDGYIARRCGVVTTFGKFMDALSDKILVATMFMTLFALNLYDTWIYLALALAIISLAREFFVSGVRMLAAKEGIVLAAEKVGKWKAALQMYSIGGIIAAHALKLDFASYNGMLWGLCFYTGMAAFLVSTMLSLVSGFSYGIRYGYLFNK